MNTLSRVPPIWLFLPLLGLVAWLGANCLVRGEYLPVVLLAVAGLAPVLLFMLSQVLAWKEPYASIACVVLIVLLSSVFRNRDIDDKSIDLQVLSKLVCLCWMGAMALTAHARPNSSFNSFSRLCLVCFLLLFVIVESCIAVNPSISLVEAGSNVLSVLFLTGIVERLGPKRLLQILLSACSCMCLMSLVAYFAFPDIGRMTDWVGDAYATTSRLQGVFGTANAAGASAAFCLLVTIFFRRDGGWRALDFAQIAIFAAILFATNNRMAVVAVVGASTLFFLCKHGTKLVIAQGVCVIAACVLIYAQYGDRLFLIFSRSGSLDEITSGTGRTVIWSVVVDLWLQRPLLGYGLGSAKFILPHHPLLFGAAAHAHNLYLNVLFASGIVGLGLLLTSIFLALNRAWSARLYRLLTLICFFLLYGITEPIIGGLASFVSMAFFSALLLTQYQDSFAENVSIDEPSSAFLMPASSQQVIST